MPSFSQTQSLITEDEDTHLKRFEFAHGFEVNLSPANAGLWTKLENGDRFWCLGITSRNAYSLNLILNRFRLVSGVKLYLYTPNHKHILGAYSSRNNNSAYQLAIEPLPGDSMIMELDVPAETMDYGEFAISKVSHDFVNIFGNTYKNSYSIETSGSCNVDVACETAADWQKEKRAVCKLIINGVDLCSGVLLNNTNEDNTPYVLTANHCIDTVTKAQSTVFIFNYEKWVCGGIEGPTPVTMSGASMVATTYHLDFALLKLYDLPFYRGKPYLAGWDASGERPVGSVCIHHPSGDYKKFTMDYDSAVDKSYPYDYNTKTHWMISTWDIGTTEGGSSGAPLFNHNHLVVGDLTGGKAKCSYSVQDYFAKFSSSWNYYSYTKWQLKNWLDPAGSGITSLAGRDPYETIEASCDTLTNISSGESLQLFSDGLTWGSYSGHNDHGITQYAEKIEGGDLKISGAAFHIARAYADSVTSFITFKLWAGGDLPREEITSRSVYIKDLIAEKINYIDFDSIIRVTGPVFLGYSLNYNTRPDTFSVYMAANRGETGLSSIYGYQDGSWSSLQDLSTPAIYSSLSAGLISCDLLTGTTTVSKTDEKLKIYPNPVTSDLVNVEVPESGNMTISIFNILGRKLSVQNTYSSGSLQLDISSLEAGVYLLNICVDEKRTYQSRFIVLR